MRSLKILSTLCAAVVMSTALAACDNSDSSS